MLVENHLFRARHEQAACKNVAAKERLFEYSSLRCVAKIFSPPSVQPFSPTRTQAVNSRPRATAQAMNPSILQAYAASTQRA